MGVKGLNTDNFAHREIRKPLKASEEVRGNNSSRKIL